MACFPQGESSPLWTPDAGFNHFLAKFTYSLNQSEPSELLQCFRPQTDPWCLARVFGPSCILSLLGLQDGAAFLCESLWLPDEKDCMLIWTFSNGNHATLVAERGGPHGWSVIEILPFDPRAEEVDAGSRKAYEHFIHHPPKQAQTGNLDWDQVLQGILQSAPLKRSVPLFTFHSQTIPLARHLSELVSFFDHFRQLGWQVDPWISIRDCTYVFRMRHSGESLVAAVKWLNVGMRNFLKKFRREIGLLREIKNLPGTPTMIDHGMLAGRPYHLCTWVKGHSLDLEPNYFKALPQSRKIRIAINTLRTVIAIHQAGILHRDIAPDHLLVADNDDVTLLDFGMSSRIDTLSEGAFQRCMENEMSNLGFTLHTLLVGGINFPFGDTEALKALWPEAEQAVLTAPLDDVWKHLILDCIQLNRRLNSQAGSIISEGFNLFELVIFRLGSHFHINV